MNRLLLILFLSTCLLSCEKEDPEPDCEKNKYGTLTISNSSSNPYDVFVDNAFIIRLNGGSISKDIKVIEGNNHKFYAVQVSGYVFYPTEKTTYANVLRCSEYSWQIP